MIPNPDRPSTPDWLDRLQQESWQAEVLISGGAFVVIIGLYNLLGDAMAVLLYGTKIDMLFTRVLMIFPVFIVFTPVVGFLLHLVLRGYWIAIVGLNYVYPNGIDRDNLKFKGKFASLIRENSNTPFLVELDKVCTQVFALTFFLILSFLGLFTFFVSVYLLVVISNWLDLPGFIRVVLIAPYIAAGVLHLVDFLTFGRMKRIGWLSRVYYPAHYLMSRVTFSFLYRRYYYTIVSNISAWKIVLSIVFLAVIFFVAAQTSPTLPKGVTSYMSGNDKEYLIIKDPIVRDESLDLSILHVQSLEPDLVEEWNRNHKDKIIDDLEDLTRREALTLVTSVYHISVDSTEITNIDWLVEKEELLGFTLIRFRTLIDVRSFKEGTHDLFVTIRLDSSRRVVRSDPDVDYYANAYFMIRR